MNRLIMMKIKYIGLAVSIFTLVVQCGYAQTDKVLEDCVSKLGKVYSGSSLSMDLNYTMFRTHAQKEVMEIQKGKYVFNPGGYQFVLGQQTMIRKEGVFFMKDDESKVMVLADAPEAKTSAANPDVKEMLKTCSSKSIISDNSKRMVLELGFAVGEIAKVRFTVDKKNYFIENIVLMYRAGMNVSSNMREPEIIYPSLKIDYVNIKKYTGQIDMGSYIYFQDGKLMMRTPFGGYDLVDQRKQSTG